MGVKRFSMVLSEKEWLEYNEIKEEANIKTLSGLIRQALQVVKSDPKLLNITRPTTSLQEAINDWWETSQEERQQQERIQMELNHRLEIMFNNIELITKKLKIPKSEREKASKVDTTGRAIF